MKLIFKKKNQIKLKIIKRKFPFTERDARFNKWMNAVKKSLRLEYGQKTPSDDDNISSTSFFNEQSPQRPVSYSIPGTLFLFSSFTILLIAQLLQKNIT